MRPRRTITIAALIAATATLAACGGGDETAPPATTPAVTETGPATTAEPATTTATETELAITETESETEGEAQTQTSDDGSEGPEADAVIEIEDGEPVGGPATVKVTKGDDVRIVVRADAEQELHLHGYEIERTVGPGKPAVFAFVAELEGIFELESHLQDAVVAKVVVEP